MTKFSAGRRKIEPRQRSFAALQKYRPAIECTAAVAACPPKTGSAHAFHTLVPAGAPQSMKTGRIPSLFGHDGVSKPIRAAAPLAVKPRKPTPCRR